MKASESSTGNLGLLDATAALLWIQENISSFGGNPKSVTVIGHGTGANIVSLLMMSPVVQKGNSVPT